MKLAAAYVPCDRAAVFMDTVKWAHCTSVLCAAGAVELDGQLRYHMFPEVSIKSAGGHLCGTNYGFFVLLGLRVPLFRLE
jgi:hypothetical protein